MRTPPFDLLSLDIELPDMKGTEVRKTVRTIEKRKDVDKTAQVKIIMVTASKHRETVMESIKSGCNDYVAKPFEKDLVIAKLANMEFSPQS